jgi:hypothetical protein
VLKTRRCQCNDALANKVCWPYCLHVLILTWRCRKVVRTYARQKRSLYAGDAPTKRRRVAYVQDEEEATEADIQKSRTLEPLLSDNDLPIETFEPPTSSPNIQAVVWSDEGLRSSPPSSPVPRSSSPTAPKRRPVFSLFKKQGKANPIAKRPFAERSLNTQSPPKAAPAKTKRMVQMQLDLASESRKACKTCGMEYIPSNAEDAALHRKFHAMNVGGVDFTKTTVERFRKNQVWTGGDGSFIAMVGRKDALALRHRTSEVLKVVNTELAAVPIADEDLWSRASTADTVTADSKSAVGDRFKTYLYIRGQKCIGACLAERIWEAYAVLAQDDASAQALQLSSENRSSSISVGATATPVILGISRIWTSNQHRKQGIATRLLDCARSEFFHGMLVVKDEVAFSQPTQSGGNLARRWFGCEDGWHVYMD